MNQAVIYHWWGYTSDAPPISNLRSSIVISIANLRAVNRIIPIYVIDISDNQQDWMNYPSTLNFKVIKQKPFLNHYSHCKGYRNLSRLFDIARFQTNIPENEIIYLDSDVFYLKDILPLECDTSKFCFNKYNSGFFYYNKNSYDYKLFQEIFESYVITALNDENFRYITKQYGTCDNYFVLDETMLHYMYMKHRNLFNIVPTNEHFLIDKAEYSFNLEKIKMFHGNRIVCENKFAKTKEEEQHSRGLISLIINQLFDNLKKVLTNDDIELMFTKKERLEYQKFDFNKQFINKLLSTKTEDGLYHLNKL